MDSLKNHILSIIGHLKLEKITNFMLVELMNNLTRKDNQKGGLSTSNKQEVYKVLSSIFNRAVDWDMLKDNPMKGVLMPREIKDHDKK